MNHFIPYSVQEVNSPARFESDFMVRYLAIKKLCEEAEQVLKEGKKIWQAYFTHTDSRNVREDLKLNRADVGWYQVRKTLEARNSSGDYAPINFDGFKNVYSELTDKLQPQVYTFGFLKL